MMRTKVSVCSFLAGILSQRLLKASYTDLGVFGVRKASGQRLSETRTPYYE
jgi:hypothetical protein